MRHFVQYHNPDKYGVFTPSEGDFDIFTDKPVDGLVGDRVWLVSKHGDPPDYVLCMTFVVDEVGVGGPLKHLARGSHGRIFSPPVSIEYEPWFNRLRQLTGNFAFGLQAINDEEVVEGLLRSASKP